MDKKTFIKIKLQEDWVEDPVIADAPVEPVIPDVIADVDSGEVASDSGEEVLSTTTPAAVAPNIDSMMSGISTTLNDLIKDEWNADTGYKSGIETIKSLMLDLDTTSTLDEAAKTKYKEIFLSIINILDDIDNEEMTHVGQLQKAVQLVSPAANKIDTGVKEAGKQIEQTPLPAVKTEVEITDSGEEDSGE